MSGIVILSIKTIEQRPDIEQLLDGSVLKRCSFEYNGKFGIMLAVVYPAQLDDKAETELFTGMVDMFIESEK